MISEQFKEESLLAVREQVGEKFDVEPSRDSVFVKNRDGSMGEYACFRISITLEDGSRISREACVRETGSVASLNELVESALRYIEKNTVAA